MTYVTFEQLASITPNTTFERAALSLLVKEVKDNNNADLRTTTDDLLSVIENAYDAKNPKVYEAGLELLTQNNLMP